MKKIRYKAGYKYQLAGPFVFQLPFSLPYPGKTEWVAVDRQGELKIKQGYAWDGPSGPTVDTVSAMRGSLIHDALYQLMRQGQMPLSFRDEADELYYQVCVADGMSSARAWLHFKALRAFGGSSAAPSGEKPILEAP